MMLVGTAADPVWGSERGHRLISVVPHLGGHAQKAAAQNGAA